MSIVADELDLKNGRGNGMGGHQSANMLKDEWLTPPHVLRDLGAPEVFDLDPAAPINPPWLTAKKRYTVLDNGLLQPWHGFVFLNPPYGTPTVVRPWMQRMADHNDGIALIFARTETVMFQELVWAKATGLRFIYDRLYFHHVDGTRAAANCGAPSVLIAYGQRGAEILERCPLAGHFVRLTQPLDHKPSPSEESAFMARDYRHAGEKFE